MSRSGQRSWHTDGFPAVLDDRVSIRVDPPTGRGVSHWAMAPVRTGFVSSAGQISCCSTRQAERQSAMGGRLYFWKRSLSASTMSAWPDRRSSSASWRSWRWASSARNVVIPVRPRLAGAVGLDEGAGTGSGLAAADGETVSRVNLPAGVAAESARTAGHLRPIRPGVWIGVCAMSPRL